MSKVLVIQDRPNSQNSPFLPEECSPQFLSSNDAYLTKFKSSDLIIIDAHDPFERKFLCRKLRRDGVGQPVIIFCDSENINERVEMLDSGADEVIHRKIHPEEFKARIKSLMRRPAVFFADVLRIENLTIDLDKREVKRGKVKIILSKTEFNLLVLFVKNKGVTLSRDAIFDAIWGYECENELTIVDVYIRFLRKKVDEGFKKQFIKTVWGVGYRISE